MKQDVSGLEKFNLEAGNRFKMLAIAGEEFKIVLYGSSSDQGITDTQAGGRRVVFNIDAGPMTDIFSHGKYGEIQFRKEIPGKLLLFF